MGFLLNNELHGKSRRHFVSVFVIVFLCLYYLTYYGTYRHHFKYLTELDYADSISENVSFQNIELNTKQCELQLNINPVDDYVKKFMKVKHLNCPREVPLTYVDFETGSLKYTQKGLESDSVCYYRWIMRGDRDLHVRRSKLKQLPMLGVKFSNKHYVAQVDCYNPMEKDESSALSYTNLHLWIPDFDFEERQASIQLPDTPSVFILVVESLSGLSFHRFMDKTKNAITELGDTTVFDGILKVGLNSFPNSMAMIAGNSMSNVSYGRTYWDHKLPYVWDHYEENGYITAFVEDLSIIGLFNYEKIGFQENPTDFYPLPFWLSMYGHGPVTTAMKNDTYYCFADVGAKVDIFLEQLLQFVHKMKKNKQPYFMYSFYSQVTHDNFNNFQLVDEPISNFIKQLKPLLENTIFIMMGDHGPRYGKFPQTPMGLVEARMPFFTLRIPQKLHKKHPHLRRILNLNKHSLMSWFDIHKMLEDVAAGNYDFNEELVLSPANPMRYLVSPHRMCNHTSIPKEFCVCGRQFHVPEGEYFDSMKAIKMFESEIRKWTASCRQHNKTSSIQIILPADNESFASVERINVTTTFVNINFTVSAVLKRKVKYSNVWTKWFLDNEYTNTREVKESVINKLCPPA